mgnify:CR=1 FL=1
MGFGCCKYDTQHVVNVGCVFRGLHVDFLCCDQVHNGVSCLWLQKFFREGSCRKVTLPTVAEGDED